MRFMTYNILTGGLDGTDDSRWQLLLNIINEVKPDILVLNECNHFELNRHHNLHRMERGTKMRGLFAPANTGFHVALFVKPHILILEHQATSTVHHAMLEARLEIESQQVSIVGVHLCPFGGQNRLAEAELLTRMARQREWVFIAGDMNSISPHDAAGCRIGDWAPRRQARHLLAGTRELDTRAIALLENAGLIDLARRAGKASTPTALTSLRDEHESYRLRIDYIFGSPLVAQHLQGVEVVNTEMADRASDHYPVFADVDLRRGR